MLYRIILVVLIHLFTNNASAETCLKVAASDRPVLDDPLEVFKKVIADNGICMKLLRLPTARMDHDFKTGKIDAVVAKIRDYEKQVGKYAKIVSIPLERVDGLLVSRGGAFSTIQTTLLKSVAIARKSQWQKAVVKNHPNVVEIREMKQAFEMVQKRRVAATVIESIVWEKVSEHYPELRAHKIKDLSFYMFLHNSIYENYSKLFEKAIIAFKESGGSFVGQIRKKRN